MSVGAMGMASSVTASIPQIRGAEATREQQAASEHARHVTSEQKAESAAGIGETTEDAEVEDRDADGRRLWERPAEADDQPEGNSEESPQSRQAADPTGTCGVNLDLNG